MNLFGFFKQELAVDLGTANTLIIEDDQVVVDEPSIVAINRRTNEVIAVGKKAMQMHEKTHENIKTIRPLKDGVIADFQAAEYLIQGLISLIGEKRKFFSQDHVDSKETYLIHEPMAAALGIGLDVEEPIGNMIIDIGGGTTEIAVIALSGIVTDQSIRTAGDEFTMDIIDYMKRKHNLLIGERTAEQIKIHVGSATVDLPNPPEKYAVNGRDMLTGIPKQVFTNHTEVAEALDKSITKIEEAVLKALEDTPPELAADIYSTCSGGSSKGSSERDRSRTKEL